MPASPAADCNALGLPCSSSNPSASCAGIRVATISDHIVPLRTRWRRRRHQHTRPVRPLSRYPSPARGAAFCRHGPAIRPCGRVVQGHRPNACRCSTSSLLVFHISTAITRLAGAPATGVQGQLCSYITSWLVTQTTKCITIHGAGACSLILSGGYREHRCHGHSTAIEVKDYLPGDVNILEAKDDIASS